MAIPEPQTYGAKNRKYSEKRKKTTTYWKPNKRKLKPKYKLSGGLVFTFSWPGESNRPS